MDWTRKVNPVTPYEYRKVQNQVYQIDPDRLHLSEENPGKWHFFRDAKVVQVLGKDAVLFTLPGSSRIFHLRNHPYQMVDDQTFSFAAKSVGVFEYQTVLGARKTVSSFDHGETPTQEEIESFKKHRREEAEREAVASKLARDEALKKAAEEQKAMAETLKLKKQAADQKVLEFQKKRAAEGFAQAQYDLGIRYLTGDGVGKDEAEGRKWIQLAADQNLLPAKKKLETMKP